MTDKEEIKQPEQEEKNTSRLHNIERSRLRGAQATRNGKDGQAQVRRSKQAGRGIKNNVRTERDINEQRSRRRKKSGKGRRLFIVLLLLAVGALFLITTIFAKAHVQVTLSSTSLEIPINGVFSAIREPAQSKGISYRQFPLPPEIREAEITNVTRELQNTRSEGTVIIYNTNPSGENLNLVNRTRVQTESGQIYRISGRQVVPGGKTVSGTFTPGSKEVKVKAEEVGAEYNLPQPGVRLSLPGLSQNSPYAGSYAITKTKIIGGLSDETLIPDPEEEKEKRQQLRKDIEKALRDSLAQSIKNNSLAERVVFEDGIFISFEPLPNQRQGDAAVISEKGTLHAISFREAEIAALLAKYAPQDTQSAVPPTRVDIINLSMSIEKGEEFDVISSTEFSFKLSGSAKLYWDIDDALFLSEIAGKTREEVQNLITNKYPQIKQINELTIFPAWRTSLPANKKKIEVSKGY